MGILLTSMCISANLAVLHTLLGGQGEAAYW
jgi:hypothetical protein